MASASTDSSSHSRLGGYVILRRIAVGGMAEVFEAHPDSNASERVVLKLLLPQFSRDKKLLRTLEHEAAINAHLTHPNLVRVLGLHEAGDLPFLVMEYVDGVSLSELLDYLRDRQTRLPGPATCGVMVQLLRALEHVHKAADDQGRSLGIVHRDVTPQNILLSRDGSVKLGDFGIARSSMRGTRTRTGTIKGKLRYLAPEQATGSAIDARADLYCAGLVLFELLTGEPYLRGETELELLRAAEAPGTRVPSRETDVDARVDVVVERAVRRFPEERFPNAEAFRHALETVAAELGWHADTRELALLVAEAAGARSATSDIDSDDQTATVYEGPAARGDGVAPAMSPPLVQASEVPPTDAARLRRVRQRMAVAASALVLGAGVIGGLSRWRADTTGPPSAPSAQPANATYTLIAPAETVSAPDPDPATPPLDLPPSGSSSVPAALASARQRPPRGTSGHEPPFLEATAAASVTASASSPAPSPHPDADRLSQRLAAMRAGLGHRGILPSDLSSSQRGLMRQIDSHLAAGDTAAAEAVLAPLEQELAALRVDGPFVRAKLDRVGAAIRAAGAHATHKARIDELQAGALQDYMAARYEATNAKLNQILQLLATR